MIRLSTLSLVTAMISGSVYATPTRTVESQQRVAESKPFEFDTSVQAMETRRAVAEARKAVGAFLRGDD